MKRQPAANAPAAQASLPCISFGPLLPTFCILISHNLVFSKIEWFPDKNPAKSSLASSASRLFLPEAYLLCCAPETRRQNTPSRYEIGPMRMLPNGGKHTEPGPERDKCPADDGYRQHHDDCEHDAAHEHVPWAQAVTDRDRTDRRRQRVGQVYDTVATQRYGITAGRGPARSRSRLGS